MMYRVTVTDQRVNTNCATAFTDRYTRWFGTEPALHSFLSARSSMASCLSRTVTWAASLVTREAAEVRLGVSPGLFSEAALVEACNKLEYRDEAADAKERAIVARMRNGKTRDEAEHDLYGEEVPF